MGRSPALAARKTASPDELVVILIPEALGGALYSVSR